MYLVLRCKCKFGTKDNGLILLTLIILVFFDNLFSSPFPAQKKDPSRGIGTGMCSSMRKIHKGKIPLFSKRFGLKNGPVIIISFTKGLRSN